MSIRRRAAVIGRPVAHSLSPAIHAAAFAELGIDWEYVAVEVGSENVGQIIESCREGEMAALSVTMPLKEAVIPHLDELSDTARALGAVNCVVSRDGRLVGHNTDGEGCCDALVEQGDLDIGSSTVLLLGAGGTARAIALALVRRGASVIVRNRTPARVESLLSCVASHGGALVGSIRADRPGESPAVDAIVNATSVGMNSDDSPLDPSEIAPGTVVLDAVYSPLRTRLLRDAEGGGAKVVDGLWMLVHQARHQQLVWFGAAGSAATMRAESERVLAERSK
ncbi:MAG: shikimate dehydrogenase [Actinomycetota bacterium]